MSIPPSYYSLTEQLAGLQAIDYFLAKQLCQDLDISKETENFDLIWHSLLLTTTALRDGHTCVDLSFYAEQTCWKAEQSEPKTLIPGFTFPGQSAWHAVLVNLPISVQDNKPIVYQNQCLYLRRYFQFETELAALIANKANRAIELPNAQAVKAILQPLFQSEADVNWQHVGVANALNQAFALICGGPGTGKTTTVIRLLAALIGLHQSSEPLQISMVAPTGKAAQRLSESIQGAKGKLQGVVSDVVLQAIPEQAQTVHRLLGVIPNAIQFKHNEDNPVLADVLLVDEASMIDLPLMTRLFRALPESCRVIMLGDADQLPSVAAGSVLADLAEIPHLGYSSQQANWIAETTGYDVPVVSNAVDYLTVLRKSHRFSASSGIGKLARAVIDGYYNKSWQLLGSDLSDLTLSQVEQEQWLAMLVNQYIRPVFKAADVKQAFTELTHFRLLTAMRQGEQGVEQLNGQIERLLKRKGLVPTGQNSPFYHGKPIMITENHYEQQLFNGDIGIIWQNEGKLMVAFEQGESIRWLSLARLPKFETVYAMTIHKTQGSEFNHVALMLPVSANPLLSRELLYTGITRAKQSLMVQSCPHIWQQAVKKRVLRHSGLDISLKKRLNR